MNTRFRWPLAALAVLVASMGSGCSQSDVTSSPLGANAPGDDAKRAPATVAPSAAMVIRAREGGKDPDQFCIPEWSIANETTEDVGALLVEIEWRRRNGDVLMPVGEFGTMVEPFTAGRRKDFTLNGYPVACSEVELVVRTFACRDANAVRMPCPGPIRGDVLGQVKIDLSGAQEGAMRGATESR